MVDTLQKRYSHGDRVDQPLSVEDVIAGEDYFYHADHLGSVRLLTDDTGAVANSYEYDAYGQVIAITETLPQPYSFTGRERDAESGFYYYRARYYDPVAGRFVSEDPIGFIAAGANLYGYALAKPTVLVDPDGRNPLIALAIRSAVISGGLSGLSAALGCGSTAEIFTATSLGAVGGFIVPVVASASHVLAIRTAFSLGIATGVSQGQGIRRALITGLTKSGGATIPDPFLGGAVEEALDRMIGPEFADELPRRISP